METSTTSKTALILVDPFNDFLSQGGKLYPYTKETVEGLQLVKHMKMLLDSARKRNMLVVYAPHRHTQEGDYLNWKFLSPSHQGSKSTTLFELGSWGAEFHPELVPQQGDIVVQNHWTGSAFANTDLDFILRMNNIERIILAGMRANTCIDSTARYGVELGYHVTLIRDGIGAFNFEEIRATVETNFPNYGHSMLSAQEFANQEDLS
ncbi:cysteine hydrolase [Flavobacterium sp. MAH-1]|uniref:Cysteine hydrolase n=1 Tax=Flavobacterium agri TaxID=2743471 RepID=A0A7Y9C747_9FLAO|nr:isochorismatase family cysteine hydrolase [Flavobacterium agri]NUY81980.1 cysteine hydrolase [Flavobacterium agri]NYA72004.1 cysteine hydrolase [Flavobacterium agri]